MIFYDISGITTESLIQPIQFAEAYRNRTCALFRHDMAAHGDRPPESLIRAPAPISPSPHPSIPANSTHPLWHRTFHLRPRFGDRHDAAVGLKSEVAPDPDIMVREIEPSAALGPASNVTRERQVRSMGDMIDRPFASSPLPRSPSVDCTTILQSILIGTAGGAGAGLTVWLVQLLRDRGLVRRDKHVIHTWLRNNTADEDGKSFRSTRAIASWTNLTEDRVRYICSVDERIYLSTGDREDRWSLHETRSRGA